MKIFDKIRAAHQQQLPFVAYRKPNAKEVLAFLQQDDELHKSTKYVEEGFVFAPFNSEESAIVIPKEKAVFLSEAVIDDLSDLEGELIEDDLSEKEAHIQLIKKGIKAIKSGDFKKVVLSRKEKVQMLDADVFYSFLTLLKAYPNAFVYIWYHPKVGLWMGATPETLVKIVENGFETMSLAGTQEYKGSVEVEWKAKEIDEQQLVTDYVLEKLKPICSAVSAKEVETIKAGNLLHLKTQINGEFENSPEQIIDVLHPTPAVCGFPKEKSQQFILENENYNREFYTGFLGELNMPNSELFVNLRCMQMIEDAIHIYVGGGITVGSDPEKEWLETVAKTKTIKNVL